MTFKLPHTNDFSHRVYREVLKIPKGKVTTYKAIAEKLKSKAYRAVGMAMQKNPYLPTVPCHRVVAQNGDLRGYVNGLRKKKQMLEAEGVEVIKGKVPGKFILRVL